MGSSQASPLIGPKNTLSRLGINLCSYCAQPHCNKAAPDLKDENSSIVGISNSTGSCLETYLAFCSLVTPPTPYHQAETS